MAWNSDIYMMVDVECPLSVVKIELSKNMDENSCNEKDSSRSKIRSDGPVPQLIILIRSIKICELCGE
jgi:hypothetical protein